MIPPEDHGLVEDTIRGFPRRELIRSRGKNWTTEHVDYALTRVQELTDPSLHERTEFLLLELRADIQRIEIQRASDARQAATDVAIAKLRDAVEKGPKPHWTQTRGFWVAVIAAIAAVIAAWPVVRDWVR